MENRFWARRVLLATAGTSLMVYAATALSSDWWEYVGSARYGHLLAERGEMVKNGETVKFWSAQLPLRGKSGQPAYMKTVYIIDCHQRTYSVVQNTAYDANESGVDIPVAAGRREIEPDSKEDALAGFACSSRPDAWQSVSNVAEFFHSRAALVRQGLTD